MSEFFSSQDLETLVAHQGKPSISFYLPTTRIPTRVQAESLQFKNLVREADEQLMRLDLSASTVRTLLEPARELITNSNFWRHQKDGLAVFLSEGLFLPYQVPFTFEAGLFVGQAFHLKPLMPILTSNHQFYIVAVSQNEVRFLRCTRFAVQEIDPATIPASLQAIMDDYDVEKQAQFHTATAAPGTGERNAIYHGVGAGATEDDKVRIREFFDRIAHGLQEYLRNENAPLVFAGVDHLFPIYQEANDYKHLLQSSIEGNPEHWSADELRRRAWRLIEPNVLATEIEDIKRFHALTPNQLTSMDLQEIVPWADKGRVDTVFVDKQAVGRGVYDREHFRANVQESSPLENRDLTDLAAIFTLLRDGNVYLLSPEEMELEFGPNNHHRSNDNNILATGQITGQITQRTPAIAAIYRYAI